MMEKFLPGITAEAKQHRVTVIAALREPAVIGGGIDTRPKFVAALDAYEKEPGSVTAKRLSVEALGSEVGGVVGVTQYLSQGEQSLSGEGQSPWGEDLHLCALRRFRAAEYDARHELGFCEIYGSADDDRPAWPSA